jgi:AbrB family looped-hinge helix DNA binding protein
MIINMDIPISSKGQITVPVEIRSMLGIKSGSAVRIAYDTDSKKVSLSSPVADLRRVWEMADAVKLPRGLPVDLSYRELLEIAYES